MAGGGFGGMLLGRRHSEVAERAWRLEALVRVFAANGRTWTWPRQADAADVVHPGQYDALQQAIDAIDSLLRGGLSRLGADGPARLAATAPRARLEALPLLGTLLTQAAGRAAGVAARSDDVSERDLLQVLARAWTLATALRNAEPSLPTHLVGAGRASGEQVEVGRLVPLAVRWWLGVSGSRGLSVTLWDSTHNRLESVTTGRAAGADPSFERSWTTPMVWGVSDSKLAGGPFTLEGAERGDDGSFSRPAEPGCTCTLGSARRRSTWVTSRALSRSRARGRGRWGFCPHRLTFGWCCRAGCSGSADPNWTR